MNVGQLARLEVVKGPATLLYSGSAMGGTINAISRHHEHDPHSHPGFRGFLSGSSGTANALAGGNAGFEAGEGNWLLWGHGSGIRTGDYVAPGQGQIYNSRLALLNGGGGVGWYGESMFVSVGARVDRGEAGVPFGEVFHQHHHHDDEAAEAAVEEEEQHDDEEEEIDRIVIQSRRESYRVNLGLTSLEGPVERFELKLNLSDWSHNESDLLLDGSSLIGTRFENEQLTMRGVFEQAERGPLSGRFGVWGLHRAYEASGEEALSPPIDQGGLAFFALEELDFERFRIQLGGRIETRRYLPAISERGDHHEEQEAGDDEDHDEHSAPDADERAFTGLSAAVGIHADTWKGGAFVANFSRSFRAPSLEELYNFGPHFGERTFEVGDPSLAPEVGNGIDVSLRHDAGRLRGELNFFYYGFNNFVFPFATGELVDELLEIEYTQMQARFAGAEASVGVAVHRAVRLNLGMDYVDAKNTESGTYLPRIPPLRGSVGLEFRKGKFRLAPRLIVANRQGRTFINETTTASYAVLNLDASYYSRPQACDAPVCGERVQRR